MAWAEKQLKRNTFGEIVPQYFDEVLDDWVPYTGVYGEVTLSGNKPVAIQTVINAQSVAPGSTTLYNSGAFTADGARRLFFAISIDKQPWTAYIMGALSTSDTTVALYPRLSGVNKTFGINYPRYTTLIVPQEPSGLNEEVIDIGVVQCAYDGVIRIVNNSQETATVTVRIIKIF